MSAAEETIKAREVPKAALPILDRLLNFLSSVRLGVVLLCILVALSMIGMLIIQQNVNGFDAYFASLTPAERIVFGTLGLFDIYHSWYYNFLLLLLSLNIILASIDRFPKMWEQYFSKPKLTATPDWLLAQKENATIEAGSGDVASQAARIEALFKKHGLKTKVTEKEVVTYAVDENGNKLFDQKVISPSTVVFGESGRINRLGAYIVHVALLTLFLGHFVALRTGFDADVRMIPGDATDKIQMIQFDLDQKEKFDVQLPFTMTCTDIQQKLIDPGGSIDVRNTLDWRTQLKVDDPEYGTIVADISMNNPFTYRGYRFFQAQTIPVGHARTIKLEVTPEGSEQPLNIEIPRMGSATLPDGTIIEYDQFLPDFTFNSSGNPDTRSGEYNRPAAVLNVTPPGEQRIRVFAFGEGVAANMPVSAAKAGYRWRLVEFEKSPFAHVLSIKYDPYNGAFIAWYFGGFGLMGALMFVFFFSHRRVWAHIRKSENGICEVVLGGNTNRNHSGFEEKFGRLSADVQANLHGKDDV
ncbi:MAG TPA: cytochrome c biogenesis protein ResB [Pyrinomonadaceae bacterium]|nr:cytochrome c biogenesis protein ResB [Pyrinomonadaceae bacterium]